ncbi:MAG: hypothetical protein M3O30_15060 [Planctomycetota bacterium]|nr:hypothetical protein [Planctomycetota bacterium]
MPSKEKIAKPVERTSMKPTHAAHEALRNAANAKRPAEGWPWEHTRNRPARREAGADESCPGEPTLPVKT